MEETKTIRRLISEDRIQECLDYIISLFGENESHLSNQAIILKQQFKEWQRLFRTGQKPPSQDKARIIAAILEIADEKDKGKNILKTEVSVSRRSKKSDKYWKWLSLALSVLLLAIGSFTVVHFFVSPIHSSSKDEKTIKTFYNKITEGITKDKTAFVTAFNMLSKQRQQRLRDYFDDLSFPDDFEQLYKESGPHKVVLINKRSDNVTKSEYIVAYEVDEKFPDNPLYEIFQNNSTTILRNFERLDQDIILKILLEKLEFYYVVPPNKKSEIENKILSAPMDDLIQPGYIKTLGQSYKLSKNKGANLQRNVISTYIFKIAMVEDAETKEPKIDNFAFKGVVFISQ